MLVSLPPIPSPTCACYRNSLISAAKASTSICGLGLSAVTSRLPGRCDGVVQHDAGTACSGAYPFGWCSMLVDELSAAAAGCS